MITYPFNILGMMANPMVTMEADPVFIPKKHIYASTAQQKREARKRKNRRK